MKKNLKYILFSFALATISCKENKASVEETELKPEVSVEKIQTDPKSAEYNKIRYYLMDNVLKKYLIELKKDKFGDDIYVPNYETFTECKFSSDTNIFTVLEDHGGPSKYNFDLMMDKISLKNSKGETTDYSILKTNYGIIFATNKAVNYKLYYNSNFTIKVVGFIVQNKEDASNKSIPSEIK